MQNDIDHFTVGAESLEQGVDYLRRYLAVDIPRGGKHDAMSTHNCVTWVADECFLELIAIDPEAPDPGRTRWFSLDEPNTRTQLSQSPRPLCWVVRTDDLDAVVATSPVDLGEVVLFTRGDRSWRLTVPRDGGLPMQGLIPAFIEWSPGPHPGSGMQDLGIRLNSINLYHPEPGVVSRILSALKVEHLARVIERDQVSIGFELTDPVRNPVELT